MVYPISAGLEEVLLEYERGRGLMFDRWFQQRVPPDSPDSDSQYETDSDGSDRAAAMFRAIRSSILDHTPEQKRSSNQLLAEAGEPLTVEAAPCSAVRINPAASTLQPESREDLVTPAGRRADSISANTSSSGKDTPLLVGSGETAEHYKAGLDGVPCTGFGI
ncbi:hypothetical protein BDV93DRAFT_513676 [Ceratobasidium sp. AG-I]|nr:hypothetical protein BDV93DRAFT_513676 [Ceratobasidium sp. AG-I]